jgi:4-amino-4-deoxy-L-arabinose transferase-like glycosyltransferase
VAAAFILVIGVALFFRLYRLDTFLHWAFGDEMSYGIEGQNVVHGIYTGLFPYTWDNAAATYAYLLGLFQQVFGATLHTDRMVSVFFGTLTVPLLALCARELEISWTGSLVAAGLLAVSHWHAHYSRMALPATTTAFVLLLAIYCMMVTYRRGHWWLFVISGVVCGAAPYMFLSNRILGPIVSLWALYLLIVDFQWVRQNWWKIAAFAATFVAVLTPLLLFWLHDPNWFMAPEHHVGIMYNVSYWAGQHPGESTVFWNVLLHQIPLALGMFVVNGGPYPPWGGTFAPAMDILTGWLFFAGALFAFSRWRRPLVALVLIWVLLTWFFGVVLTLDAPQMEHAVGMIPGAFLLIAFLLDTAGTALMPKADRPLLYVGLAALLVGVSGVLNYQAYFQNWGSQLAGANGFAWQFYDAATYVGRHPTPNGTAIYSWGYPDEFFRFLAPQAKEFPGDEKAFRPASLYIVIADAAVSPQAIAAHVPEARLEAVYDIDGDLAFTAILPPSGTHLTSSLVRAAPGLCHGFSPPAPSLRARETTGASHAQRHGQSIGQPWPHRFDPLTQIQQIAREVTIIDRTHVHAHGLSTPRDPPRKAVERCQPPPGRVSVGGRNVVLAGPHHHIDQRHLQHGYHVILHIVEFIHRALVRCQVFQLSEAISSAATSAQCRDYDSVAAR